ncbi:hypothetical protein ACFLUP_04470 [Chloroflexota bacterium]
MKLARSRESGQVFIMVLILLTLVPLLVIPMLRLCYSSQMYHQAAEIHTLNVYAADSGVEYGRFQIYNFPMEIQETPLAENITINGIDVYVTAEYDPVLADFVITSTASRAGRSQTIECTIVIDVGLFGNVIACSGNLMVYQCDFSNPEYPGESDLYTDGNIDITNSTIDGDIRASGNITVGPSSVITGDIVPGAEVLEFPEIDAQIHKDRAQAGGNFTGDYYTSDQELGPLYIDGSLNFGGNDDVVLTGTVYVTGDVNMFNADVTGFGDIVSEGDITFTNYTYTVDNPVTLPLLMTVGEGKTVNLGNDQTLGTMAIIYAPIGVIDLNNVDVYGSVAAPLVQLNAAKIIYPAELRGRADLPGAGLDTVTYIFR